MWDSGPSQSRFARPAFGRRLAASKLRWPPCRMRADCDRLQTTHDATPGEPSKQLALCSIDPTALRANVRAHGVTMAPHGFNAYALGVLATRSLLLVLNPPQDLAERFVLLRKTFWPWGDEIATDLRFMRIPSGCLPAVALDAVEDATYDCFAT